MSNESLLKKLVSAVADGMGACLSASEAKRVLAAMEKEEPLEALAQLGDAVPNNPPEGGGSIRG